MTRTDNDCDDNKRQGFSGDVMNEKYCKADVLNMAIAVPKIVIIWSSSLTLIMNIQSFSDVQ